MTVCLEGCKKTSAHVRLQEMDMQTMDNETSLATERQEPKGIHFSEIGLATQRLATERQEGLCKQRHVHQAALPGEGQ